MIKLARVYHAHKSSRRQEERLVILSFQRVLLGFLTESSFSDVERLLSFLVLFFCFQSFEAGLYELVDLLFVELVVLHLFL